MILPGFLTHWPLAVRAEWREGTPEHCCRQRWNRAANRGNRREVSPLRKPTGAREANAKKRRRLAPVEMTGVCGLLNLRVWSQSATKLALAPDYCGHWVWRADSMSGSRRAPRHLAVHSWVEVRPLAPRRSAPEREALGMSASRRTAAVRNAPCRSAPFKSVSRRIVPLSWAPPSLACAIFAEERSACWRLAK